MASPFPHLPLLQVIPTTLRPAQPFPRETSARTKANKENLSQHGGKLLRGLTDAQTQWEAEARAVAGPAFAGDDAVPYLLQLDPAAVDVEQLRRWGFEVVAVEEDGFVVCVAPGTSREKLLTRLQKLLEGQTFRMIGFAALWDVLPYGQSLDRTISPTLWERWTTLDTEAECFVEVTIALANPAPPSQQPTDLTALADWRAEQYDWDQEKDRRTQPLERIVAAYDGAILDQVDQNDTTNYLLRISGKCVRDLALNAKYVLAITEADRPTEFAPQVAVAAQPYDVELLAPAPDAPRVCVIDSGIQTGHRLLAAAVDPTGSRTYVPDEPTVTADMVPGGGHGTRVAGAILYPQQIPTSGTFQAVAWIQNARVLNAENALDPRLSPARLMRQIVGDYRPTGTRLFNLSVQRRGPCRTRHMSTWAAELDQLSFTDDVLFIVSAGNITGQGQHPWRLTVAQHLSAGRPYPSYLLEDSSRISDPAQSCQALTVGSVCIDHLRTDTHSSFGERHQPSAFSRSGLGMWRMVKPDVVEYAGDLVQTNVGTFVTSRPEVCPELVCATFDGHPAVARTAVGTSFAAPKVAHIVAALAQRFPNYRTLMYRALIVQSAQWPKQLEGGTQPEKQVHLRTLGYGIPDLGRATENTENRVTFIREGSLNAGAAHLYAIRLDGLATFMDDTPYRLEITLSYAARPRRTRQKLRGYLSTTLQWTPSKRHETLEAFNKRVRLALLTDTEGEDSSRLQDFEWQIGSRANSVGSAEGVKRQDATLQKDWAFVRGYDLTDQKLYVAVTGHRGWAKELEEVPYALVVSITSLAGQPIYERVRLENQVRVQV
jgi:Subtilase family